jgi:thioredoxin 2
MKVTVPCAICGQLNRVDLDQPGSPKCGSCGRPILLDRPVPIGDESFDRVVADSELPVVLDCYADWCGPCKIMAPIFDEFAAEQQGKALVAKLDTDRHQRTAMKLNVRSIPTLILFRKGAEVARRIGAVPKAALQGLLDDGGVGGEA